MITYIKCIVWSLVRISTQHIFPLQIQPYLRDIMGSVPEYHNKVTITIKQVIWKFWFPGIFKVIFTTYCSLYSTIAVFIALCLEKQCAYLSIKILYCGGSGWGTHVNPWLIHVNVWQKPLQYCKVISLQLIKINEKINKNTLLLKVVIITTVLVSHNIFARRGSCLNVDGYWLTRVVVAEGWGGFGNFVSK